MKLKLKKQVKDLGIKNVSRRDTIVAFRCNYVDLQNLESLRRSYPNFSDAEILRSCLAAVADASIRQRK